MEETKTDGKQKYNDHEEINYNERMEDFNQKTKHGKEHRNNDFNVHSTWHEE
jgi:hypothetical protein